MFSIPIAIIRKKNLPYLSICQEIYFSFKHHTPGVYGNHKTSHSDEEAEAISSAINIFNFCLQHEKKLKSFLNLNPKCCLIVHIWLGLFRRNKSCWCQQCVQWHINLAYPGEHRGHGKGVWQVQLCGNIATGTGFLIFLQSAQDKCFPNSSLFKHNKAKEREREREIEGNMCHLGINVFPWTPKKHTAKVCWPKVHQEKISSLCFKLTENTLLVSVKFISCCYRQSTCAAKFWWEVCLVWAVTGLQYIKGCWAIQCSCFWARICSYKAHKRLPRESLTNPCSWLCITMKAMLKGILRGSFSFCKFLH